MLASPNGSTGAEWTQANDSATAGQAVTGR